MDKVYINWTMIDFMVEGLTFKFRSLGYKPDRIIGIERGGLIPAVMLSHRLGIRQVDSIRATSYTPDGLRKELILRGVEPKWNDAGVLVVDDIIDTGATYHEITKRLPKITFCALVTKTAHPAITMTTVSSKVWVVFPWEQKVL
jgi:xanthine phosphoribosyltransferase